MASGNLALDEHADSDIPQDRGDEGRCKPRQQLTEACWGQRAGGDETRRENRDPTTEIAHDRLRNRTRQAPRMSRVVRGDRLLGHRHGFRPTASKWSRRRSRRLRVSTLRPN